MKFDTGQIYKFLLSPLSLNKNQKTVTDTLHKGLNEIVPYNYLHSSCVSAKFLAALASTVIFGLGLRGAHDIFLCVTILSVYLYNLNFHKVFVYLQY
jgi:hypothetical protein